MLPTRWLRHCTTIPDADHQAAVDLQAAYKDFYLIIPAKGPLTAFWAIHQDTGTLLGVLADGSGGAAVSSACADFKDANNALSALGLFGDLGPYGALGKAVAAVFAATAIILDGISEPSFTFDADQLEKDIASNLVANMASDAGLDTLGGSPGFGKNPGRANTVSGILGGPSATSLSNNPLAALGCG
jgi:hypothetical protein